MPIFVQQTLSRHRISASLLLMMAVLVLSGQNSPRTGGGPTPTPPPANNPCDPRSPYYCFRAPSQPPASTSLSLGFEANAGQSDARYQYLARGAGYKVFLAPAEAVIDLRDENGASAGVLQISLESATRNIPEPLYPLPGRVNYFIGNDPARWVTDVPTFERIRYPGIYPGIDVLYYGSGAQLEHDFIVAPGADPTQIRFQVNGAEGLHINADGALIASVGSRRVTWSKPLVYQDVRGVRHVVDGAYRLDASGKITFQIGAYDRSQRLVIDPVVLYATFLGKGSSETASRVATDSQGNVIFTGVTRDGYYPVTPGTVGGGFGGTDFGDVVVTKINAAGDKLVFSTHMGGAKGEGGAGLALDAAGNIYIAGGTNSEDFPVSATAFQRKIGGTSSTPALGDCFVAKLNASGSQLLYSTYLGGNLLDGCTAVAVDTAGSAYVTGVTESSAFPVTEGSLQRNNRGGTTADTSFVPRGDAFVTKLTPDGSSLAYSTYLGGTENDAGMAITVDSAGNAYVAGLTVSSFGFPVTPGAFQTRYGGTAGSAPIVTGDGFAVKLNAAGSALVYGTYLGGTRDDIALSIAVDKDGNAYIGGSTTSENFPVTATAYQTTYKGAGGEINSPGGDGFLVKLNPTGTAALYSSYLGGSQDDRIIAIAPDAAGGVWVAGSTVSANFPVSADALQKSYKGSPDPAEALVVGDAFFARFTPDGKSLSYSTYYGGKGNDWFTGIAVDSANTVYLVGGTSSADFPVTQAAIQRTFGGADSRLAPIGDAVIVKYGEPSTPVTPPPVTPTVSISSVASAASYAGGGVAPGEILVLTGSGIGPATLTTYTVTNGVLASSVAGTRMLFDNTPAPIIYVSATQSSAIAPYSISGRSTTQLVVEVNGVRSQALALDVVPAKPALFSANSSGRGPGAILNQDNQLNTPSNPAAKGSIVILYGTGEGQTDPPGVDGQLALAIFPKPILPATVTIGGQLADVLYFGAAPGIVGGMFQANVRVPDTIPSGDAAVLVSVGGRSSQSNLTVSVR